MERMRSVDVQDTRPVWAEVSAGLLRQNYRLLRRAAGLEVEVLAVVKANAYGHGATECAPVLADAGASWLGVTSVEEGVAVRVSLRSPGGSVKPARILVMCGVWFGEQAACLDAGLTPVVWETYHLDLLEREAQQRGLPSGSIAVHLEIDTGMARQGVSPGTALENVLTRFTPDSPLLLEGVLTHFASAEVLDDPQNRRQWTAFASALQQVQAAGLRPAFVHAGNTSGVDSGAAATELPEMARGMGATAMTRAGLALYGHALPLSRGAEEPASHLPGLRPVLDWKTRVVSLRDVAAGATIGYNATFVAPRTMRLALLPVGYADGFRRALSSTNAAEGSAVLLHGRRASVVGRVSMDLSVVDVSAIPEVQMGDEAVLLGESEGLVISAAEHARLAGTSVYEVLCGISDRVPRLIVD